MNPPIRGHKLLHEGDLRETYNEREDYNPIELWSGGCQCGAKPDGWPHVGTNAMKRWHRQHKAELRGES